jgi:atypical dual specificity phosphatase
MPSAEPAPALELEDFGVGVGSVVIVSSVTLTVPARSACFLVGPSGSGKSSLLRAISGVGARVPGFRTWGTARCGGRTIGEEGACPALVSQCARLYISTVRENLAAGLPDRASLNRAEQEQRVRDVLTDLGLESLMSRLSESFDKLPLWQHRAIAVARAVLTRAPAIMIDEPTAGLKSEDAEALREVLKRVPGHCGLLCVTHNRNDAFAVGGQVALFTSGEIKEEAGVQEFFHQPRQSDQAQTYVQTGSCLTDQISPPTPTVEPTVEKSMRVGPRGFSWVVGRQVGAMPRPGLLDLFDAEAKSLALLGITHVVCLEEKIPYSVPAFRDLGVEVIHFPIVDMDAPGIEDCRAVLRQLEEILTQGGKALFHCKGGLGRTGTMLAALLVSRGTDLVAALDQIHLIERRFVQSEEQREFLERFASAIRQGEGHEDMTGPAGQEQLSALTG